MKILIVSQHYYPEPFRVTRIAENLAAQGHDVTVLTGIPNYPKGDFYPGYSYRENRSENIRGVKVIRAREHPRKHGLFHRALNYLSFAWSGETIAKKLPRNFDVTLAIGLSPIHMDLPAIAYKKKTGTPIVMYEMDLWPESLVAGGIKPGSLIYNHYRRLSAKVYSQVDKILVSTPEHIDRIKLLLGEKNASVSTLLQFADDIPPQNLAFESGKATFLFAGNIGKAQNLETLLRCAELLKGDKRIAFLIAGDGSESERIKQLASGLKLSNVSFLGRLSRTELAQVYQRCSAGIVCLEDELYCRLTIPGKVQSYLKIGLPIFGLASGATHEFVKKIGCGSVMASSDFVGLSKALEAYTDLPKKEKESMSKRCKIFYKKELSEEIFMKRLIEELKNQKEKRGEK